ncbi:twin-arginine translocation signal domain-containing protein [Pedobacter sp. NJ-S-72]
MTSRRSFLKSSAMLSAGLLIAPGLFAAKKKKICRFTTLYCTRCNG